jgi:hypothetical protein
MGRTPNRKQHHRWTVLPQGFIEFPSLLGQNLDYALETFNLPPPPQIKLFQYVDDLLISGDKEKGITEATIASLNFLGQHGLRVSKSKPQFVEKEVKYLGHLISGGKWRLSLERISGITICFYQLPKGS